eukprot:TRINITY_DN10910_c0_g1_i4.p1 TRINITY_DN10910_c0_g1~~TRINITY_DN10910_c0_g1_i4.p1  ORF type:complete len:324 (+),score=133.94 TRINITY_DN10910_c0_g1_i4:118-1089(+)
MPKKPVDLVKRAGELVENLEGNRKNMDEFNKTLAAMKVILFGAGNEGDAEAVGAGQLAMEMYNNDLLMGFVMHIKDMDFEGRKDTIKIFNKVLRRQVGEDRMPTVDYVIRTKPEILTELCRGYESPDIAMSTGMMLRECIKHEPLAKIVLLSEELFYPFFGYVQMSQFDLAADAFASFKDLLTKHKILAAKFLEDNYDKFMTEYDKLLNSENYVTKRQSLKLLGELLLDRANFTTMTKYISSTDNLKLMMNLLRDKSRNIQFEAFHVFKVFVANPNKSPEILHILVKNKEKLLTYLEVFHNDKAEDEQFSDEKAYLMKQIKEL